MSGPNPKLYRELSSTPFITDEAANAALDGFRAEVAELRKKYRILNLYVIAQVNVAVGDDDESQMFSLDSWGDPLRREPMVAYAFGQEQAHRDQMTRDLMKRSRKLSS